MDLPLIVVDGANVVGSVPDGWWRDRRGAALRLRDRLAGLAEAGLPVDAGAPEWALHGPLEVVLVLEGAARGVEGSETVRVLDAPGVGDDAIVELVQLRGGGADAVRHRLVVTSDRELRRRVGASGAEVRGPRVLGGPGRP